MNRFETLNEMLLARRGSKRIVHFIAGEDDHRRDTFDALVSDALACLAALQDTGLAPGDELVVFTDNNREFLVAFWAAILGGMVPVPVAVGTSDEHRRKLFRILRQLRRPSIASRSELLERLLRFAEKTGDAEAGRILTQRAFIIMEEFDRREGRVHPSKPDDLAFIQYSSGSTSDPKGVCLTHGNVCSTCDGIIDGLELTEQDSTLSWMPLTHDMGLIGYHVTVMIVGMDHAIMDTPVFIRRPLMWLQQASKLGSTVLCSPNFGYRHFLKVFERKGIGEVDLSRIRLILNGAEPISVGLCEEFLHAMQPHGLHRTAMLPVYGLAEATLAVTFPRLGEEYRHIAVDRHALAIGKPFVPVADDAPDGLKVVKLGRNIGGCELRIVDADDTPLDDGRIGHIQVRGPNVTRGLYGNETDATGLFSADGWLRTGDCGAIADDELVITGRQKEIIIVNGQNYVPHDIEEVIAAIGGLDLGKVVVCGARKRGARTEELLVFVLYRKDLESFASLADEIGTTVGKRIGLEVDHVIPVARIPKTTSGKIQRNLLSQAYIDGEYDDIAARLRRQVSASAVDPDEAPLVRELEAICAEFSRDRVVGPDDNLFEVGISSLTLTEIMLAVDEKYPGKVDINDLFDHPTLRELAQFLRR